MSNVFRHCGDLGDAIACLPTIRQLGGGRLILGNRNGIGAREPMTQARFDAIAPLLRVQDYITDVTLQDDASGISHDFADFRTKPPPANYNLATWQANYFGINDVDLSPWLFAHKSMETKGRAVFARSGRYQNPNFDWRGSIVKYHGALFVGLPDEWSAFRDIHGVNGSVEYRPTSDLLEVAELIAGSEIFVGNQSAPCWIAMGLGHPLVQEMDQWEMNHNSVVTRPNAIYCCRQRNAVVTSRANARREQ